MNREIINTEKNAQYPAKNIAVERMIFDLKKLNSENHFAYQENIDKLIDTYIEKEKELLNGASSSSINNTLSDAGVSGDYSSLKQRLDLIKQKQYPDMPLMIVKRHFSDKLRLFPHKNPNLKQLEMIVDSLQNNQEKLNVGYSMQGTQTYAI